MLACQSCTSISGMIHPQDLCEDGDLPAVFWSSLRFLSTNALQVSLLLSPHLSRHDTRVPDVRSSRAVSANSQDQRSSLALRDER